MKKKPLIGIIDTQTSNIKSVYYALNQYNIDIEYISSKDYKKPMDAMIVPGIGNFSFVMGKLKDNKFDKLIETNISKNIPSLFICVGMQILFTKSYEFGEHNGLNIFSINRINSFNFTYLLIIVELLADHKSNGKSTCELVNLLFLRLFNK